MGRGLVAAAATMGVGAALGIYLLWRRCWQRSASTHSALSAQTAQHARSTLLVCTTCSTSKREGVQRAEGEPKRITGPTLFRSIVGRLLPDTRPEDVDIERAYEVARPGGAILRVQPQKCLSACSRANCIALSHPSKCQYHFAMLEETAPADIEDIVAFACDYADRTDEAFTKKGDRPERLRATIVSRLPPPVRPEP